MTPLHIRTRLTSETVHLPGAGQWIGQEVDIVVSAPNLNDAQWAEVLARLQGSVVQDDDPFGPAVPPQDWEAVA
jgi:hypothetical protein